MNLDIDIDHWEALQSFGEKGPRKLTHSQEYKTFRDTVLSRDKRTCRVCNKTGNATNVPGYQYTGVCIHHIYPKDRYVQLIFTIGNGITLCAQCRLDLHSVHPKIYEQEKIPQLLKIIGTRFNRKPRVTDTTLQYLMEIECYERNLVRVKERREARKAERLRLKSIP